MGGFASIPVSVVTAVGVGDRGGFGGASEGAAGFEALVSYREVGSGHFWVGEAPKCLVLEYSGNQ